VPGKSRPDTPSSQTCWLFTGTYQNRKKLAITQVK
jgi:hypothetical protein